MSHMQVFEGLACVGYRLVKQRSMNDVPKDLFIKPANKTLHRGYELTFVKDLSL